MFHDPSPSLNTHPRDERTAYAEQREAERERHCPDWEPGFPGETLVDALGRAANEIQEAARNIEDPDWAADWRTHVRAIQEAICQLRKTK
jgi:hypothetical protein